jgi:FkbM family methyltransferase
VRMRAALARAVVSPVAVRAVDPITRRRVRHRGLTIQTDHEAFTPYTRAELLWGLYERTEISYIRRFLKGSAAVIELGAGLGVASAHIASQMRRGGVLVCVEANPRVLDIAKRNMRAQAERAGIDATLINAALGDQSGETNFVIEDNLFTSHVDTEGGHHAASATVRSVSLQSIRDEFGLTEFDLVCDIEGAETQFIVGADPGLDGCRRIVIELHPGSYQGVTYSVGGLLGTLGQRFGFQASAVKGDVASLERS